MNNRYPPERLEKKIGYEFKDKELLLTALTHSSFKNEPGGGARDDYERQEFLGDAVLELVSSEFIYRSHPDMREGEMTKLRASIVCEPSLAESAKEIELSEHIILGHGEDMRNSRYKDSIVSDVFEALIGGIFLDSGLEEAGSFIKRFLLNDIEKKAIFRDSKTQLQNLIQSEGRSLEYVIVDESGPDHCKSFTIAALIDGEETARGKGSSKKAAAQQAAYETLRKLRKS
ncbi:MAG: ribonuclease III [Lachnospiraceae bacterium]|nr:ribonuclease III [Lachnospiraceae bacterium]